MEVGKRRRCSRQGFLQLGGFPISRTDVGLPMGRGSRAGGWRGELGATGALGSPCTLPTSLWPSGQQSICTKSHPRNSLHVFKGRDGFALQSCLTLLLFTLQGHGWQRHGYAWGSVNLSNATAWRINSNTLHLSSQNLTCYLKSDSEQDMDAFVNRFMELNVFMSDIQRSSILCSAMFCGVFFR